MMTLSMTREGVVKGRRDPRMVRCNGAQARRPITVSAGTTSIIGRLPLVSCEAWRDETDIVYQDTTAIDSVPYGEGFQ